MYDTLIVGGGMSGMSAALILGRCRRNVAIFDNGMRRNRFTAHMNGYLGRDGINPAEFAQAGRMELLKYKVDWYDTKITGAGQFENNFWITDVSGKKWYGRKLLIATGLSDNLPEVPGFDELYGKTVFHCPICDGWESRDKKIVVYGKGKAAVATALQLVNWSQEITICTHGASWITAEQKSILDKRNICIISDKITRFDGRDGQISAVIFENHKPEPCERLYFTGGYKQHCDLAYKLGCRTRKRGREFWVSRLQMSSLEGVYISGDAAFDMKMAIVAAAEGAKAGVAINLALMESEGLRLTE